MASQFNLVAELHIRGPSNLNNVIGNIQRRLSTINANVGINVNATAAGKLTSLNTRLGKISATLAGLTVNANNATTSINALISALGAIGTRGAPNVIRVAGATSALTKSMSTATSEIQEFGRISALAFRRFAAFSIPTGAMLGLIVGFKRGVAAAVDFERQMISVQQVTGRSRAGLAALESEITRLGTTFGVSSVEMVKVSRILSQAGLSANDTRIALDALAKTTLSATFDNIESTTEGAIAAMAQFKLEAKDLNSVLSSMSAVAGAFAVESADIVSAIRHTGGAFQAAGGNLNELMALFTSVRATTRESADSIATGFRTIFTRMQRASTIDMLKQLGVELQDVTGKFVGPYEAVRRLSAALQSLDPRDIRFAQIVEELGGYRQISKVVPLIQQFNMSQRAMMVAQAQNNILTDDAVVAQQSLAVQVDKLREAYLKLFRDLSQSSAFKSITDSAIAFADTLQRVLKTLEPMLPAITSLATISAVGLGATFAKGFIPGLGSKIGHKASGGIVGGTGNTDSVPALLTPGEFVINKRSASKIGIGTLSRINKYASGGMVPYTGMPRSNEKMGIVGETLLLSGLMSIGASATETGSALNKVTTTLTSFGLQVGILTSLSASLSGILKNRVISSLAKPYIGRQMTPVRAEKLNTLQAKYADKVVGAFIGVSAAGAAASTAISMYADNLQKSSNELAKLAVSSGNAALALKSIEEARSAGKLNAASSWLSGGSTVGGLVGGLIGTIFGSPIAGAMIGAGVVGGASAAYGYSTGGEPAAQAQAQKIRQEMFSGAIENFSGAINDFTANKPFASLAVTVDLAQRAMEQYTNTVIEGTSEERISARRQIAGVAPQVDILLGAIVKGLGITGYKDLSERAGGVAGMMKQYGYSEKAIDDEIKKRIKANEAMVKSTQLTLDLALSFDRSVAIARDFGDALSDMVSSFDDNMMRLDILGGGNVNASRIFGPEFNEIGRAASGKPYNVSNYERALTGLTGPGIAENIRRQAVESARMMRELPEILRNIANYSMGDEEAISQQLRTAVGQGEIADRIMRRFDEMIAKRSGAGEGGILKDIRENVGAFADTLLQDVKILPGMMDTWLKARQEQEAKVSSAYATLHKVQMEYVNAELNRLKTALDNSATLFELGQRMSRRFEPFPAAATLGNISEQQRTLLGGQILSPNEIGNRIRINEEAMQKPNISNEEFTRLRVETDNYRRALQLLSDSTTAAAAIQKELSFYENQRNKKFSTILDYMLSGAQGRSAMMRGAWGASIMTRRLESGMSPTAGFTSELLGEIRAYLERFSGTGISLAALGGRTVEDIQKMIVGAGGGGEFVGPAEKEKDLMTQLESVFQIQSNAQAEISALFKDNLPRINAEIRDIIKTGNDRFQQIVNMWMVNDITRQRTGLEAQRGAATSSLEKFGQLEGIIRSVLTSAGLDPNRYKDNKKGLVEFASRMFSPQMVEQVQKLESEAGVLRRGTGRGGLLGDADVAGELAKFLSTKKGMEQLTNEADIKRFLFKGLGVGEEFLAPLVQAVKQAIEKAGIEYNVVNSGMGPLSLYSSNQATTARNVEFSSILATAIDDVFNDIITEKLIKFRKQSGDLITATVGNIGAGRKESTWNTLVTALSSNAESVQKLTNAIDISLLSVNIQALSDEISRLTASLSSIPAVPKALGGSIFKPRGTDTVPAMLTPGEFVVNAKATRKFLPLLRSINAKGYADGGRVDPQREYWENLLGQWKEDEERTRKRHELSRPIPKLENSVPAQMGREWDANYQASINRRTGLDTLSDVMASVGTLPSFVGHVGEGVLDTFLGGITGMGQTEVSKTFFEDALARRGAVKTYLKKAFRPGFSQDKHYDIASKAVSDRLATYNEAAYSGMNPYLADAIQNTEMISRIAFPLVTGAIGGSGVGGTKTISKARKLPKLSPQRLKEVRASKAWAAYNDSGLGPFWGLFDRAKSVPRVLAPPVQAVKPIPKLGTYSNTAMQPRAARFHASTIPTSNVFSTIEYASPAIKQTQSFRQFVNKYRGQLESGLPRPSLRAFKEIQKNQPISNLLPSSSIETMFANGKTFGIKGYPKTVFKIGKAGHLLAREASSPMWRVMGQPGQLGKTLKIGDVTSAPFQSGGLVSSYFVYGGRAYGNSANTFAARRRKWENGEAVLDSHGGSFVNRMSAAHAANSMDMNAQIRRMLGQSKPVAGEGDKNAGGVLGGGQAKEVVKLDPFKWRERERDKIRAHRKAVEDARHERAQRQLTGSGAWFGNDSSEWSRASTMAPLAQGRGLITRKHAALQWEGIELTDSGLLARRSSNEAFLTAGLANRNYAASIKEKRGPGFLGGRPEGETEAERKRRISDAVRGARGYSAGGDVIPAMLSPGEFVLNRGAVQHLSKGGFVTYKQDGGLTEGSGGGLSINSVDMTPLKDLPANMSKVFAEFESSLTKSLNDSINGLTSSPLSLNDDALRTSIASMTDPMNKLTASLAEIKNISVAAKVDSLPEVTLNTGELSNIFNTNVSLLTNTFNIFNTSITMFGTSVDKFSKSVVDLQAVMGTKMEHNYTINGTIDINGADKMSGGDQLAQQIMNTVKSTLKNTLDHFKETGQVRVS